MPKLYPCSITLTQENTPLAAATVTLVSTDPDFHWAAGGTTDSNGVCVVRTRGKYQGAPEGTFKVTAKKFEGDKSMYPDIPPTNEAEFATWTKQKQSENLKTYRLIDEQYMSVDSTPLEVEVVPGKNRFGFDLGTLVKVPVETSN